MSVIQKIALAVLIIGGLNWGLVGLFDLDLVSTLFGASIINMFFPSSNGFFSKVATSESSSSNLFNTCSPNFT